MQLWIHGNQPTITFQPNHTENKKSGQGCSEKPHQPASDSTYHIQFLLMLYLQIWLVIEHTFLHETYTQHYFENYFYFSQLRNISV